MARVLDAIDEPDFGVRQIKLDEAFFQVFGLVPLPGAEIGDEINHAPLALVGTQQLLQDFGLQRGKRLGGGQRRLNRLAGSIGRLEQVTEPFGKTGIDPLLMEIRPKSAAVQPAAREPQQGERLRLAGLKQRIAQAQDCVLGLV